MILLSWVIWPVCTAQERKIRTHLTQKCRNGLLNCTQCSLSLSTQHGLWEMSWHSRTLIFLLNKYINIHRTYVQMFNVWCWISARFWLVICWKRCMVPYCFLFLFYCTCLTGANKGAVCRSYFVFVLFLIYFLASLCQVVRFMTPAGSCWYHTLPVQTWWQTKTRLE